MTNGGSARRRAGTDALCLQNRLQIGDGLGDGAHPVGESGLERVLAAVDRGFRGADRIGTEPAVAGDEGDQRVVEVIDVGLDVGGCPRRQRLVRVAVGLAGAGVDQRPCVDGPRDARTFC